MKKFLLSLLLTSIALPVHASDYGCKVLLCLSNPASNGGARGVPECVPPINQLYDDLKHGRGFPTCDMADGNDGTSWAQFVNDPYDPCPAPLVPAKQGDLVLQDTPGQISYSGAYNVVNGGNVMSSQLPGIAQTSEPSYQANAPRACVGKLTGICNYCLVTMQKDNATPPQQVQTSVNIYDKVVWQQWQKPGAVDVYLDRQFNQRVRLQ